MLRGTITRLACTTSNLANRAVAAQGETASGGRSGGERQRGRQKKYNNTAGTAGAGAGAGVLLAAVGVKLSAEERVKAVEKGAVLDIEKEDKIRQYHPIDSLFDYFSSYQLIDNKGKTDIKYLCQV